MKYCVSCKLQKPDDEFYVRPTLKDGLSCYCKVCTRSKQKATQARWRERNPEYCKEEIRKRRESAEYREGERETYKKYYYENLGKVRAKSVKWNHENSERRKVNRQRWFSENPHKRNESRMKGYASKVNATPEWADKKYIDLFYQMAKLEEERTGRKCHVDHIVPLRSDKVCGLHVEHNLQVMYAVDNQRKQNLHWPDM